VDGTWLEPLSGWLVDRSNQEVAMIDKPKPTDTEKQDDDVLEPEEVASDAAETAFMQDEVEREDAKK
jgi:hypothetical protein